MAFHPEAERHLQTVNRQRRQGDDKGGHDAGGDSQLLLIEKVIRQPQAHVGISERDKENSPATEALPAQRHEQRHGADGDQATEVIEDMGEVETWRILLPFGQKGPELLGLGVAEQAFLDGGLQIVKVDFHIEVIKDVLVTDSQMSDVA